VGDNYKHKQKIEQEREREREREIEIEIKREHAKMCLPSSVQYWPSIYGERSTIMMSNFTKDTSKGSKNQSSNLILPQNLKQISRWKYVSVILH